ncbi:12030_t:CDS:2, partial [Rhizophagus irregularis]
SLVVLSSLGISNRFVFFGSTELCYCTLPESKIGNLRSSKERIKFVDKERRFKDWDSHPQFFGV